MLQRRVALATPDRPQYLTERQDAASVLGREHLACVRIVGEKENIFVARLGINASKEVFVWEKRTKEITWRVIASLLCVACMPCFSYTVAY